MLLGGLVAGCGRLEFDPSVPVIDAAVDVTDAVPPPPDAMLRDVAISLTADIQYVLAVGDTTTLHARIGEADNSGGTGILPCPVGVGPERWEVIRAEHPGARVAYIATWDDQAIARGMVGQFASLDGSETYTLTGDEGWQVCAVGEFPGGGGVLTDDEFALGLAACNAGTAASGGWVDAAGALSPGAIGHLIVGGAQGDGVPLGPVCDDPGGVPLAARWVWYHPTLTDPVVALDATGTNDCDEYLIFRYPL